MKNWLFNPFTYIAGLRALLIGFAFMLVTLVGAYYGNLHFGGVIDARIGTPAPFQTYLLEGLSAWLCPVILFYLLALALSKSRIRLIDIAGTMAIARAPMLLVAIITLLVKHHLPAPVAHGLNLILVTVSFIVALISAWMVVLMFNAFTVSANLWGTKAVAGFIFGLIVSELICYTIATLYIY